MSGGLNGSAQHFPEVCSRASENPKFVVGVDLSAARLCSGPIGNSRSGLRSSGSIVIRARPTLPGTLRITEVHFHIRGHRKVLVFGHFQSAVPRQRASQGSGEFTNMFTQCCHNLRRISGGYLTRREDLALKQKAAEPNLNDIILQRR